MKSVLLVAMLLLTASAMAAEKALSGAEIARLLPMIVAVGDNSRQTFTASGATTYIDGGRQSAGRWRVQDNLYCSQWPPSGSWACYQVLVDGEKGKSAERLIWVGNSGKRTINRIDDNN